MKFCKEASGAKCDVAVTYEKCGAYASSRKYSGTGTASTAASLLRCDSTAVTISGDKPAAARRALRSTSNVSDMTMPKLAIASKPATLETALLTPEATPTAFEATDCMTVVVSGATVNVIPNPSTSAAGKKVVQ